MENIEIPFYSNISYITKSINSNTNMLVFNLLIYLKIMTLLLDHICHIMLQNSHREELPMIILKCYHNQFLCYFRFRVYLAIKIIVLFDPFHWTYGYGDTLISFGIVIVRYDNPVC